VKQRERLSKHASGRGSLVKASGACNLPAGLAAGSAVRRICRLFEDFRYRHDVHSVFSDFCEMAAIAISNSVDLMPYGPRETRYMGLISGYEPPLQGLFPRILGELVLAFETGPGDVMGEVFHELGLHNRHAGQFFTPYPLCRLAAMMQVGDGSALRQMINEKGYVTLSEPACGAGAMIVAFAQAMREAGLNYQRHLHVTAVDIDRRAVHMAYLQLSLMHIPATLVVGDTLRLIEHEHWHTPAHVLGGWSTRLRRGSTPDAEISESAREGDCPVEHDFQAKRGPADMTNDREEEMRGTF